MYLKNIEVQGFKSFAQKINFEFHNGITGIVGPNGSGKSNVGDAVRWVLGEQSAKQLRGGNMQDVIFSGTENRKPLSYAYVAITLDNSDHKLPIEYNEVTVARRLYRSGESEYLINGSACRLKDINELFYDTGIGKEGYSIIGQGQIDKILSGKPEERRELFDEAAGIVKFKRRKAATLKKLGEEQQNLVRVTDILSELTKQLAPLERQAETAKIYLQKKETLKQLDVNMFLLEMGYIGGQLKEVKEKYELAEHNLQQTSQAYEQTKEEYQRLERELEKMDEKIERARGQSQENALRRQQLEGSIHVLQEQINAGRLSDEHYQSRLTSLEEDIGQKKKENTRYSSQREKLQEQIQEILKRQKALEERLEYLRSELETCTAAVEDGKNEIIEILNRRANTKGKVQRFDTMMEQVDIRKAQLSQKALQLKSDENDHERLMEEAKAKYQEITDQITAMQQKNSQMEAQIETIQKTMKEQNRKIEIGQTAYHREASRLESLRNITERYDGYGNSIRRVMEQKKTTPGIRGVVADLIHVVKDYEIAIETALGGSIQNIVTDNEQTAKFLIQYLKKNRYGRATFLPLTNISSRGEFQQKETLKESGVIGLASELVEAEPEYQELVRYLLGKTLVVDHIDHAIAIGKKYHHTLRMVTIDGESLNPGGSMTGGAYKNNSNLLGRRREIEELESSVQILKRELEQMQQSMQDNRDHRNRLREELLQVQEQVQKQYILQNTVKLQMQQLDEKKSQLQSGYEKLEKDKQEIVRQTREIQQKTDEIKRELETSKQEEKELEDFIAAKQTELEQYQAEEGNYTRQLETVHLEYSEASQKETFIRENMNRINRELQTLLEEKEMIHKNLEAGSQEMQQKEEEIRQIQKTIEAADRESILDEKKLGEYQAKREDLNSNHKTFFEKRDELSGQMTLLDKECFRLGNQMERLEEKQEAQINYMWEEYEITPNNAIQYRSEEISNRSDLKKSVAALKEEIRKLGNVNVNAIEDFKEVKERHTFLSSQYQDLIKAEETLKGIIEELDTGMRKQFTEKFRDIQREFDKAFKELFGGGKGTLELMENEDILEAGIRIISQPPGKKLQNMMQLSGEEKALTAIALLFAIQNLKPSPFCLLDEIEAALDDSNVVRYAKYLKKLTKNTQFIIITHRRGTMNAADRLYGITMQEKGVSTLVSVDLVEHELDK